MAIAKDFGFIGRLCLDFAQTGDMGWGTRFERLTAPSELRRWLSLSPLRLERLSIHPEDLARAKMLRGAIWRIAEASLAGVIPRPKDVRLLNRRAWDRGLTRELDLAAKSMRWHRPTVGAALATIAQDAVALFGDPAQRARIRRCENSGCRVIFYDDSRPGLRRWCASNRCGDRIRAKAYRARHRSQRVDECSDTD
ncbi:MAG: ABATE domain-containing protein [Acidobacteriia bacterium]|nr:ABATE domain-containing protein [Terriglobia bacterium]